MTGYARDCQSDRQPLVIENEIEKWRNRKVMYKGKMASRHIMKMQVSKGDIHLVCPNDSVPFPYFKNNMTLSNSPVQI